MPGGAPMPRLNADIAEIFAKVADLLEIQGANPFRVRAYRTAARTVESQTKGVAEMVERGEDLTALPGIGEDLAAKLREIVATGRLALLEQLEQQTPGELSALMSLPGLGPKRVMALYRELGVSTIAELQKAAADGKLRGIPGFGEKTELAVLEATRKKAAGGRIKLSRADEIARSLVEHLKRGRAVKEVVVAGSFRRRKETVGDLDVLATSPESSDVMDRFVAYDDVRKVLARGETRSTVLLSSGVQVDLRVVLEESYGAALHYFTGSKAHNIAIRARGMQRRLKINEYGVFKGAKRIAGRTEEEVFAAVGLPFIEPELREDAGEVEAAAAGSLPRLIAPSDIRGDLHAHTSETDGRNSLEEMAAAAQELGYEYLAVTDHTKRVTMAHGFDAKRLARRNREIDRLNAKLRGLTLLKSAEVDILEDGTLDLPDAVLRELDLTVCSVHYNFKLSREKQTERILRAMDNAHFTIFAHPTGRLINQRDPYDVDLDRLMRAAKERGRILEINAHPDRLDLVGAHARAAKEQGIGIAISTDAHSVADLGFMHYGVEQARRGWLEARDVINTRSLAQLRQILERMRG